MMRPPRAAPRRISPQLGNKSLHFPNTNLYHNCHTLAQRHTHTKLLLCHHKRAPAIHRKGKKPFLSTKRSSSKHSTHPEKGRSSAERGAFEEAAQTRSRILIFVRKIKSPSCPAGLRTPPGISPYGGIEQRQQTEQVNGEEDGKKREHSKLQAQGNFN